MIFEVCVDSVEGAIAAQTGGAQRVELCDNLVEGGTTPSLGMIQVTRQSVAIEINVIIRPRGGDFVFSELELEVMRRDILAAKQAGANAVVIGALQPDGTVDVEKTRILMEAARPLKVTFHRAFDLCRNPEEALETLCGLGVDRILTSGQKNSAVAGLECIGRMVQRAAGRTIIMAGGGVNEHNIRAILSQSGVSELHFAARKVVASPMTYRNPGCHMGKAYAPDEYARMETEAGRIRKIIRASVSV
jgi:copper homeostasis protein